MGENAQILIKHNRRTVRKLAKELGEAFAQCESLRKNLLELSHSATEYFLKKRFFFFGKLKQIYYFYGVFS